MRYINGLYDFLADLARRHPGLILDNCASSGRRLDKGEGIVQAFF